MTTIQYLRISLLSGAMSQHLMSRKLRKLGAEAFDIFPDRLIEPELAFLSERHQNCGGEDFTCRAAPKKHVWGNRSICLKIRNTEGFHVSHSIAAHNCNHCARNDHLLHLRDRNPVEVIKVRLLLTCKNTR